MQKFLQKIWGDGGSRGFTMIELLVVIAVIGVLAVAVLSAINPIEQINKGRDTRTRSDAAEMVNASDRYYAIQEEYPWNSLVSDPDVTPPVVEWDPSTVTQNANVVVVPTAQADSEFAFDASGADANPAAAADWAWANGLLYTAEVKAGFINRLRQDNNLYVYKGPGYNETMYACFRPLSNGFKKEAADNCDSSGTNVRQTPDVSGLTGVGLGDIFCDTTDGTLSNDNWICLP